MDASHHCQPTTTSSGMSSSPEAARETNSTMFSLTPPQTRYVFKSLLPSSSTERQLRLPKQRKWLPSLGEGCQTRFKLPTTMPFKKVTTLKVSSTIGRVFRQENLAG